MLSWTSWNVKLNVAVVVLSYRCCRMYAYWLIQQCLQVDVYTTLFISSSSFIDTLYDERKMLHRLCAEEAPIAQEATSLVN